MIGEYIDKTKIKTKQAAGGVTGSKKLEREGHRDEAGGRAKGAVNETKDRIENTKKSFRATGK